MKDSCKGIPSLWCITPAQRLNWLTAIPMVIMYLLEKHQNWWIVKARKNKTKHGHAPFTTGKCICTVVCWYKRLYFAMSALLMGSSNAHSSYVIPEQLLLSTGTSPTWQQHSRLQVFFEDKSILPAALQSPALRTIRMAYNKQQNMVLLLLDSTSRSTAVQTKICKEPIASFM